jgi:peroxiredoxin Q/BCP
MTKDAPPEIGSKAPLFALPATGGKTIALRDFIGKKNVVLYFYPKDDTPGCTMEACDFRDDYGRFEERGTVILGVSRDGLDSHTKFTGKLRLPFLLLSDADAEVAKNYGAYGKKSFMGREFFGIHRMTFVIDAQGTIRQVYPKVLVKGHTQEVLGFIESELA